MFLRELVEIRHDRVDGIFHMQMPNRYPDWIKIVQFGHFAFFSTDRVDVCITTRQSSSGDTER